MRQKLHHLPPYHRRLYYHREPTQAVCLFMFEINIVNLYRGMSKLKLKINVKVPQLLCIVVSVALNGEFERFGGFCVN